MKLRRKKDGSVELGVRCSLCNSEKLDINITRRVWYCFKCNRGGSLSADAVERFLPLLSECQAKYGRLSNVHGFENLSSLTSLQVGPNGTTTPQITAGQVYNDQLPDVAKRYIERRGFDPDWLLYRYRIRWDERSSRICFPCGSGWSRRAIYPWQQPKTITDAPRDILGAHLLSPGQHVVITEGDFKSASIPLPWIGVGLCGKTATDFQIATLRISRPASITVLLDSGEDRASEELSRKLLPCRNVSIPTTDFGNGKGPDDIPRHQLLRILLNE